MSLYDKLSSRRYGKVITGRGSKSRFRLAFDREMARRIPEFRYPATRCRPVGLRMVQRHSRFGRWKVAARGVEIDQREEA